MKPELRPQITIHYGVHDDSSLASLATTETLISKRLRASRQIRLTYMVESAEQSKDLQEDVIDLQKKGASPSHAVTTAYRRRGKQLLGNPFRLGELALSDRLFHQFPGRFQYQSEYNDAQTINETRQGLH